jgi:hypothetical protein
MTGDTGKLNIVHLNTNGLVTKRVNKLNSPFFTDLFNKNDILLFTETWTSEMSDITVNNFDSYPLHRLEKNAKSKRDFGGLIAYIRSTLKESVSLFLTDGDDVIILKIDGKCIDGTDTFLFFTYVLPENTTRQAMQVEDSYDIIQHFIMYIRVISLAFAFFSVLRSSYYVSSLFL